MFPSATDSHCCRQTVTVAEQTVTVADWKRQTSKQTNLISRSLSRLSALSVDTWVEECKRTGTLTFTLAQRTRRHGTARVRRQVNNNNNNSKNATAVFFGAGHSRSCAGASAFATVVLSLPTKTDPTLMNLRLVPVSVCVRLSSLSSLSSLSTPPLHFTPKPLACTALKCNAHRKAHRAVRVASLHHHFSPPSPRAHVYACTTGNFYSGLLLTPTLFRMHIFTLIYSCRNALPTVQYTKDLPIPLFSSPSPRSNPNLHGLWH